MDIRPFPGWRYARRDVSDVLAPPYDILHQQDKDDLLARSERNIVAVDLPHVPPKQLGPESEYVAAAETLGAWKTDGTLAQDPEAIYVYQQTYRWAGQSYTRRGMIAGVRATALGEDVIPHEHTFAGPKADRLKLTELTRTQLSSIFGFYDDPDRAVANILAGQVDRQPDASGMLHGVKEELWAITDRASIDGIRQALAAKPVYIADGHHRYTTAMNYRDALAAAGSIDREHPANFVMFTLVAREDPGLLVLPTHRLVRGLIEPFSMQWLAEQMGPTFTMQPIDPPDDLADMDAILAPHGPGTMGLMSKEGFWTLKLTDPDAMAAAAPDQPQPWRKLDVAVLHTLILEKILAPAEGADFEVSYTPDGNQAAKALADGWAQVAFCLQGTPLAAVEAVADAGASMPHKSTYFYPKLATGLVLKPLI
ncbi:MAG: DUF1015 domain-containing protein [Phycisphaerae bacterium]